MENKYLLAIDGSSTEVGFSIFNKKTKELIEVGHLSHDKDQSLIEKAEEFNKLLEQLLKKYPQILGCIFKLPN